MVTLLPISQSRPMATPRPMTVLGPMRVRLADLRARPDDDARREQHAFADARRWIDGGLLRPHRKAMLGIEHRSRRRERDSSRSAENRNHAIGNVACGNLRPGETETGARCGKRLCLALADAERQMLQARAFERREVRDLRVCIRAHGHFDACARANLRKREGPAIVVEAWIGH